MSWSARPSLPSRPGEFHPEPLTDPYVNLSIHTARVITRRLPPSAGRSGSSRFDPVGPSSTAMTTPFAPRALPRFIATTGQSAPLQRIGTFALAVGAACALYGVFIVKQFQSDDLAFSLFLIGFFVRPGIPFLRPHPQYLQSRRAQELSRLAVAPTFLRAWTCQAIP